MRQQKASSFTSVSAAACAQAGSRHTLRRHVAHTAPASPPPTAQTCPAGSSGTAAQPQALQGSKVRLQLGERHEQHARKAQDTTTVPRAMYRSKAVTCQRHQHSTHFQNQHLHLHQSLCNAAASPQGNRPDPNAGCSCTLLATKAQGTATRSPHT